MITSKKIALGYDYLKSLQQGGVVNQEASEKANDFILYFARIFGQQINPEKYSQDITDEQLVQLYKDSPEEYAQMQESLKNLDSLPEEQLAQLSEGYTEYTKTKETNQVMTAAKGAKLQKLRDGDTSKKEVMNTIATKAKAGTKIKKKRKCSCGCDLVLTKASGGKIMEMCSCKCGGKLKKKK